MRNSQTWPEVDAETAKSYDIFRRTAEIMRRTAAAMGRVPKAKITVATTQSAQLNERYSSTS